MSDDHELIPVAEKLRSVAAAYAAEADRSAQLSGPVVTALRDSGIVRHFVPRHRGGADGGFLELTRAVVVVAEGCPSTAWVLSLAAASSRFAAFLPVSGQQEVWQAGPDSIIATGLVPAGAATETDQGWRLTGTWSYVSGVEWADWVLLCGPGSAPDRTGARFFAVPASQVTIRFTWDSTGMRATGSHTVTVDDVLVPQQRTFTRADLMTGRNTTSRATCHTAPLGAAGGLTFAAPLLGAANAVLACTVHMLAGKGRGPAVDRVVARASGQLDAARLLVERAAAVLDAGTVTRPAVARNARDCAVATDLVIEAVAALVRATGTSGLARNQPLERLWRDVTCAASHVALRPDTSATPFVDTLPVGGMTVEETR